jgi:Myb/SANT-like DNA-binding domain
MPPTASNNPPKKPRAPNTKWNSDETESLVEQLKQAKDEGQTSDNGFKKTVWVSIANSFEDVLKTDRACETKWARMKKDYKEVKFLREASGFGWDKDRCVPTAEPEVWEDMQKVGGIVICFLLYI